MNLKTKINLKNRKGQLGESVNMILLVVGAIILFALIVLIFLAYGKKTDIEVCRISVAAQANTKFMVNPLEGKISPFNIDCKKRFITIYDTKVEMGKDLVKQNPIEIYYNGKETTKFSKVNDYIVNQVVAEEMRICYYQFGEGKLAVFNSNMFKDNDVCFICSEITFDKSIEENTYEGFMEYLKANNIDGETKVSYYSYFNQTSFSEISWDRFLEVNSLTKISFQANKHYFVVFTKQDRRLFKLVGVDNNYFVYVVPSTEISKFCDIQAS